jgi:TRAP-type mannitol/chloroaromatic compound transport system permease small subunit
MGQLAHATIFMIGAAYAWRWNSQIRIDIVYQRMQPRMRAIVDLIGTVALLLPWLALVIWYSVPLAELSVRIRERFPETGSPGSFMFRVLLLAFSTLMLLQAIAVIARAIVVIRDSSRSKT